MTTTWQDLVADKRQRQQDGIPKEWLITVPPEDQLNVLDVPARCGLLTDKELVITSESDVDVILGKLASGEWSSVEVTTAFYKRAIIAQQVVNCLTEIFVEKALARAAEVDEYLKVHGKPMGPLHGLPISLKDQLHVKGLETTMGYVSWIGQYAEKDAALVEVLYEAGAVPFVKTNIPQTLMWPETFNNVFGRTLNPHNRTLTSGGSSGGEGALIALHGSVLGVGSDIGGSIRIPAAFCGLYGLRPSYGRVPYQGAANSMEGQDSVPSVFGPLSTSLTGVKSFMKAVIHGRPWTKDPLAVRKAWDEEAYQLSEHGGGKDLVFGIMWNDGITIPHPPILRGLEETKAALLAAGHKVVDFVPYKHKELCSSVHQIWDSAAAEDYRVTTAVTGEPVIQYMGLTAPTEEMGFRTKSAIGISAYKLWQIQKEKLKLRKEYLDHWEATASITGTGRPVDAIITPIAPYAAPPHGRNWTAMYTTVFNVLDYPACIIPVSKIDPALDVKKPSHGFLNATDKTNYELYEPEAFKGAPIAVQLVGRTLEEEAVIGMAEIIDEALKKFHGQQ